MELFPLFACISEHKSFTNSKLIHTMKALLITVIAVVIGVILANKLQAAIPALK